MFILPVNHTTYIQLLQLHHANELFQLVNQNRKHLRQWLPWVDNMRSPQDYETIIPMWLDQFANNNGFQGGIRYNGQLAGMLGLHYIDWNNRKTSIGYYLAEPFEGRGIMTQCVQQVIEYAFFELDLNRVEIRCGVQNKKSRAIPERLGFQQEGIVKEDEWLYDHYHDIVIYGLVQKDYIKQKRQP